MTIEEARFWLELLLIVAGIVGVWVRLEIRAARHDEILRQLKEDVHNIWKHINPVPGGGDD